MATAWTSYTSRVEPYVPGCPRASVLLAIRNAAIEFCAKTSIWREEQSQTLVEDKTEYTVSPATGRLVALNYAAAGNIPGSKLSADALDHAASWREDVGVTYRMHMKNPTTMKLGWKPEGDKTGAGATATGADPVVVTDANHGLTGTPKVQMAGFDAGGAVGALINGNVYIVTVIDSDNYSLKTLDNQDLDGSAYTDDVSAAGTWAVNGLEYELILKPTETETSGADLLFDDWVSQISAGAISELMNIPGKDWSNPGLAVEYKRTFNQGINDASSIANKSYIRGSSRVQMNPWR